MGKNPCIIIKEQGAKARKKRDKLDSFDRIRGSVLDEASDMNNGLTYGFYDDLVKAFMMEGYPAHRAEKHIQEWVDNDLLSTLWIEGYHLVGYDLKVF